MNMGYGPDLTPKQKQRLEEEIKNFNLKKTKALIEKNAVGKPDVDAYPSWTETHPEAEPSDEDVFKWGKPAAPDIDISLAQMKIKRLLTLKQWKVWQLVMQQSLTHDQAAKALGITRQSLSECLDAAKERVQKHFSK